MTISHGADETPDDTMETVEEGKEECVVCGYVLAGIGLVIGALFLYMSFDVLSGGKITSALGLGTAREVEE